MLKTKLSVNTKVMGTNTDTTPIWHPVKPPQAYLKKINQRSKKMTTDDKLKKLIMQIIKKPVEAQIIPGGLELEFPKPDKVIPGYDTGLEKLANKIVEDALNGNLKSIEELRKIVGNVDWSN